MTSTVAKQAVWGLLCATSLLVGCAKKTEEATEQKTSTQSKSVQEPTVFSGHVDLGVLSDVSIEAYSVDSLGQPQQLLYQGKTDAQGNFAFTLLSELSSQAPIQIQANLVNAQMTCPIASGCYQVAFEQFGIVAEPVSLHAIVPDPQVSQSYKIQLSPFTEWVYLASVEQSLQYNRSIEQTWSETLEQFSLLFAGIDPTATPLNLAWQQRNDKEWLYRSFEHSILYIQQKNNWSYTQLLHYLPQLVQRDSQGLHWATQGPLVVDDLLSYPEFGQLNNPLLAHFKYKRHPAETSQEVVDVSLGQHQVDETDSTQQTADVLDLAKAKSFVAQLRNWLGQIALIPKKGDQLYQRMKAAGQVIEHSSQLVQQQLQALVSACRDYVVNPDLLNNGEGEIWVGGNPYYIRANRQGLSVSLSIVSLNADGLTVDLKLHPEGTDYVLAGTVQNVQDDQYVVQLRADESLSHVQLDLKLTTHDADLQPIQFNGSLKVVSNPQNEALEQVDLTGEIQLSDIPAQRISIQLQPNASTGVDALLSTSLQLDGLSATDVTLSLTLDSWLLSLDEMSNLKLVLSDRQTLMTLAVQQMSQGALSLSAQDQSGMQFSYQQDTGTGSVQYHDKVLGQLHALSGSLVKITYNDGSFESIF